MCPGFLTPRCCLWPLKVFMVDLYIGSWVYGLKKWFQGSWLHTVDYDLWKLVWLTSVLVPDYMVLRNVSRVFDSTLLLMTFESLYGWPLYWFLSIWSEEEVPGFLTPRCWFRPYKTWFQGFWLHTSDYDLWILVWLTSLLVPEYMVLRRVSRVFDSTLLLMTFENLYGWPLCWFLSIRSKHSFYNCSLFRHNPLIAVISGRWVSSL